MTSSTDRRPIILYLENGIDIYIYIDVEDEI